MSLAKQRRDMALTTLGRNILREQLHSGIRFNLAYILANHTIGYYISLLY